MRRIVGVAGAASVVLGFLLAILLLGSGTSVSSWALVLFVLLIPAGFLMLWETQVAWPRDGSPYPWRRRAAWLLIGIASFAVVATIHGLLRGALPSNWLGDAVAQTTGLGAGLLVFLQLRRVSAKWTGEGSAGSSGWRALREPADPREPPQKN